MHLIRLDRCLMGCGKRLADDHWDLYFSDGSHPLKPFLKSGFGHVLAARRLSSHVIIVHPASERLQVEICSPELLAEIVDGYLLVPEVQVNHCELFRVPGPFNCVEVVKALLGVRNPFIITPFQLYRYVTNGGASDRFIHKDAR